MVNEARNSNINSKQWRIQEFPQGDPNLTGGANSRGAYMTRNLYAKMKESGPLGGARQQRPWIRQWWGPANTSFN